MADTTQIALLLADYALSLPGAHEDHPWGTRCAKVNNKIFCGLGGSHPADAYTLSLKLTDSLGHARSLSVAEVSAGWGRYGWIALHLHRGDLAPDLLLDWVEESYRAVAPKRLITELDTRPDPT